MPTLTQPLADGVFAADYRDARTVLFDTTSPRWWVVDSEVFRKASASRAEAESFVSTLRNSGQPTVQIQQVLPPKSFYVIYKLTDKCNFGCTYCYDRNFTRKLDPEKRNQTVRNYLTQLQQNNPGAAVNILFHGGEPLLEFQEITDLLAFGETLRGIKIAYSLQSNASLLDQEKVGLLRSHSVGLCFSVDGVQASDNILRVNNYNPNCYELIKRKIRQVGLATDCVGLLFTIGAHNVTTVCESIKRAEEDGFTSISFSFMHDIDRATVPATPEQVSLLYKDLIMRVAAGDFLSIAVWTLIDWILRLTFGHATSVCNASPCGAGRSLISILPNGEVSPCDSLFSDEFIFKDVESYEKGRTLAQPFVDLLQRHTDTLVDCSSCDVRRFCNGTCPGSAALSSGTVKSVNANECAIHYSLIKEIVWMLADSTAGPRLLNYARHHTDRRRSMGLI